MLSSERSAEPSIQPAVPRAAWVLMASLTICGPLVHLWTVGFDGSVETSTLVFASVGAAFLGLALVSHVVVELAGARHAAVSEVPPTGSVGNGPIGAILVPMAVRFVGTFAILGVLHFTAVVSRNESVFDILFWYVSLTTIEIVGIVWASKSATKIPSLDLKSATKGV